jgi:hypothetical protein
MQEHQLPQQPHLPAALPSPVLGPAPHHRERRALVALAVGLSVGIVASLSAELGTSLVERQAVEVDVLQLTTIFRVVAFVSLAGLFVALRALRALRDLPDSEDGSVRRARQGALWGLTAVLVAAFLFRVASTPVAWLQDMAGTFGFTLVVLVWRTPAWVAHILLARFLQRALSVQHVPSRVLQVVLGMTGAEVLLTFVSLTVAVAPLFGRAVAVAVIAVLCGQIVRLRRALD